MAGAGSRVNVSRRGRTHAVASTQDHRPFNDDRDSSTERRKGKGESFPKPPAPQGEALCNWAARVSLKGTEVEQAPGRRQSPHMPEGWGRAAACGRLSLAPAHQHAQGSSKAVSSKSCPPVPRDRQLPAGGRPLTWLPIQFSVERAASRDR